MALARCGIVGVTRPNAIWDRNLRRGSGTAHTGTGKHHRLVPLRVGTGRVAEMVDPHVYKRWPTSSPRHLGRKHAPPLRLSTEFLIYELTTRPPDCRLAA